jgi:hypothetical protein
MADEVLVGPDLDRDALGLGEAAEDEREGDPVLVGPVTGVDASQDA